MTNKELIQSGLLELYALGHCTEKDRLRVEEALLNDEAVRREFDIICATLEHVAADNAIEPPADAKQRLMDSISGQVEPVLPAEMEIPLKTDPEAPKKENKPKKVKVEVKEEPVILPPVQAERREGNLPWPWLAAASIALLMGSLAMSYVYYNRWQSAEDKVAILTQDKFLLTDENGLMKIRYDSLSRQYDFLESKDLKVAVLNSKTFDGNRAIVMWDRNSSNVYLLPSGLKPLEKGQQYQLWAIAGKTPVDLGTIPLGSRDETVKMKKVEDTQAFAITIEKEGGSPTPTLEMMVAYAEF